jgi:hypothetical protein
VFVGNYLLLRDFGPYGMDLIFMSVCVLITVVMIIPLTDFWSHGVIFMTVCVFNLDVSVILDGQFIDLNRNLMQIRNS